eukprot:8673630-Pyramimonas_sp.AAC.1
MSCSVATTWSAMSPACPANAPPRRPRKPARRCRKAAPSPAEEETWPPCILAQRLAAPEPHMRKKNPALSASAHSAWPDKGAAMASEITRPPPLSDTDSSALC